MGLEGGRGLGRGLWSQRIVGGLRGVGGLGKIFQHCCGKYFFPQVSGGDQGVNGETLDNGMDMSMDLKKERIRELKHRQKVRFGTLLLPLLLCATLCVSRTYR